MKTSIIRQAKGFSFIEVIITVAMVAIAVAGLASSMSVSAHQASEALQTEDIKNIFSQVRSAFGDNDSYCTAILGGRPLSVNEPGGSPVASVDYHDANGKLLSNVISTNSTVGRGNQLVVRSIAVKPTLKMVKVHPTDPDTIMATLEVSFSSTRDAAGATSVYRQLPLLATMSAAGTILSCSTSPESTITIMEKICEIQNDGYSHYDLAAGTCVDNSDVKWFVGTYPNIQTVTCGPGYVIAAHASSSFQGSTACDLANPPTLGIPPETYDNGTVYSTPVQAAFMVASIPTNSCNFIYIAGVNLMAVTPRVKCVPQ